MNKLAILSCLITFLLIVIPACRQDEDCPPDPIGLVIDWDTVPRMMPKTYSSTEEIRAFLGIPEYVGPMLPMPPDNPLTDAGIALGRKLFYDPILSADSTLACAGCHDQAFGFTDQERAFSIGVDGIAGTRNSMALINLAWSDRLFWDGLANTMEEQALEPVPNPIEMHLPWEEAERRLNFQLPYRLDFYAAFGAEFITREDVAKALAQFERTLVSFNSKYDRVINKEDGIIANLTEQEEMGREIFESETGDCFHCHGIEQTKNLFTNNMFLNNGLDFAANFADFPDKGLGAITGLEQDNGKFKVPTLRNIELTAPYMHDGRFETLEEVVEHYNSGVKDSPTLDVNIRTRVFDEGGFGLELTEEEKAALVAFLKTLTDTTFANNPNFSSPF